MLRIRIRCNAPHSITPDYLIGLSVSPPHAQIFRCNSVDCFSVNAWVLKLKGETLPKQIIRGRHDSGRIYILLDAQ